MRLHRSSLVLLALLAIANPAEAQAAKPLTIAGATGAGEIKEIKVQIETSTFNHVFYVQTMDKTRVEGVKAIVNPLVAADGRWIQPAAAWLVAGRPKKSTDEVVIDGLDQIGLRISASLPIPTTYAGTIDLLYGDARHSFKLTIERAAQDDLDVRDKEFTWETANFKVQTAIQGNGKQAVYGVRVVPHDLVGPAPRPITPIVTVNGERAPLKIDVPAASEVPMTLEVTLPVPGTYTGVIDLFYGRRRQSVKLKITRADAKVPVTIRPVEAARAETYPWRWSAATLHVVLEGTRAEPLTLKRPAIVTLSRKESDKVAAQAGHGEVAVRALDASGKWRDVPDGLTLEGRTPKKVQLTIPGLDAGEYTGMLSVSTGDLSPQEAAFTVYVRRSVLLAIVLIALGVVGSWRLRLWALRDRPRLTAQREIATVAADIETTRRDVTDATDPERTVLTWLATQLRDLFDAWNEGTVANSDARLKSISGKLLAFARWVTLRRRFASIQLPVAAAGPLRDRLHVFAGRFTNADEDVTQLSVAIGQLDQDLTAAVRAQVTARIASIRQDLARQKQTPLGQAYAEKLDEQVEQRLQQAEQIAADAARLAEAAATVDQAGLIYAQILAAGFEAQLPPATPDPLISADVWDKTLRSVREQLDRAQAATDATTASSAYTTAYCLYLKPLLTAMQVRLSERADKIKTATGLTENDRTALNADWDTADQLLNACQSLLATRDTTLVALRFEELRKTVKRIGETVRKGGGAWMGTKAPGQAEPASAILSGAVGGSLVSGGFTAAATPPTRVMVPAADLDRKLKRGEKNLAIVTGVIGVLLGVKLLWMPSPTWGDWGDYIVAVLWGLGLHQVSGATVGQFNWSAMLQRVTGGANPPN